MFKPKSYLLTVFAYVFYLFLKMRFPAVFEPPSPFVGETTV